MRFLISSKRAWLFSPEVVGWVTRALTSYKQINRVKLNVVRYSKVLLNSGDTQS